MIRSLGASLLLSALMALSSQPVSAGLIGLSSDTPGALYTIDSTTGAATHLVDLTGASFTSIVGLEYLNGVLYATDVQSDDLFRFGSIDIGTGAFTPINNQSGSANWFALAADPTAGLLYSVDYDAGSVLVSITPAGLVTQIGATGVGIGGLAFDTVNNVMYGMGGDDNLYTVDLTTGVATLVGSTGLNSNNGSGLAFDAITATLFVNNTSLYSLNTATGASTLIGANNAPATIDGLAFVPDSEVPEPASLLLAALGGGALLLFKRRG